MLKRKESIVTMGTLIHSCAEFHEPIELSFEVVSGVSLGIRVLDDVPCRGFSVQLV